MEGSKNKNYNMKQSAKTSRNTGKKSNVTVGGNNKSASKFRLVLFSLAAILVVSVVGFFGYNKYQAKTLRARASGYATLVDSYGYKIQTCKYSTPWGYGVRFYGTKPPKTGRIYFGGNTQTAKAATSGQVNERITATTINQLWDDRVGVFQLWAPQDGWYSAAFDKVGYGTVVQVGPVAMAYTPFC